MKNIFLMAILGMLTFTGLAEEPIARFGVLADPQYSDCGAYCGAYGALGLRPCAEGGVTPVLPFVAGVPKRRKCRLPTLVGNTAFL